MILGEPLENLLLRMPHRQVRHALRQGGRGVSGHDPQLQFQRRKGLLPILARFLEGFAGKAAQRDRSESGADPATVVRFLLLPAVFLLLVSEVLRQGFGVFGLEAIEDRFQGLAAHLPQKSLQLFLKRERGLRSNTRARNAITTAAICLPTSSRTRRSSSSISWNSAATSVASNRPNRLEFCMGGVLSSRTGLLLFCGFSRKSPPFSRSLTAQESH